MKLPPEDAPEPIPSEDWVPWPVSDSSDYLDRPAPRYMPDPDEEEKPMKLPPEDDDPDDTAGDTPMSGTPLSLPTVAEQDAAIGELLAANAYMNADGKPFIPDTLIVDDPIGDADLGDYEDDEDDADDLEARP